MTLRKCVAFAGMPAWHGMPSIANEPRDLPLLYTYVAGHGRCSCVSLEFEVTFLEEWRSEDTAESCLEYFNHLGYSAFLFFRWPVPLVGAIWSGPPPSSNRCLKCARGDCGSWVW